MAKSIVQLVLTIRNPVAFVKNYVRIHIILQFYLPGGIYMMDSLIQSLPDAIRKHIEGREYTIDDIGKSGSKVLIHAFGVITYRNKLRITSTLRVVYLSG